MKRFLAALLAFLMCFGMLVSCGDEPADTTDTTTTTGGDNSTPGNEEPEDPNRTISLVSGGETEYRIILASNAREYEWDAAYQIRLVILTMTGTAPAIMSDDEAEPQDKEIIIGSRTNRKDLYTVPEEYGDGYCVFIDGDRLVFETRSAEGMKRGLQKFCRNCLGVNIVFDEFYKGEELSELTVQASYVNSEKFNTSSFFMIHDDTVVGKRLAYAWLANFKSISGPKYIVESDMAATAPANTDDLILITLTEDATVGNGKWELHKKDEGVYEVKAADYYGFFAASFYFKKYVTKSRQDNSGMEPYPASTTGSYLDEGFLTKATESAKYAFEHTSDIRVMFNNVLFNDPNPAQRNLYNAEIAAIYLPDVYGLQEVNTTKRGYTEDGSGGVIAELAKLGYVETLDARVRNAYGTNEDIPGTDAGPTMGEEFAGQPLKGYGGGTKVTVNGETFNTYYNHTPLLYNKNTTKYITGDYYWYKNQWDKRPGQNHENWANDCGSKSATWGLFEDIETGARYIVISTHMCTRSDYVRGLQGAEMVALIDSLIAQYDVPVMLGGDYNGNTSAANYQKFVEGGLINVQLENLPTVYNSPAKSAHGPYPEVDPTYKIVVPAAGDNSGKLDKHSNIDHIMVKNHESMEITVFGVVIDDMSITNADHFPIFFDFSIDTTQEE